MPVTALTNGKVHQKPSIVRLGDTVPKTQDFEVNDRVVKGYLVKSRRFPSSIAGEIDDARNEYMDRRIPVLPDGQRPTLSLYRAARALSALFPIPEAPQNTPPEMFDQAVIENTAKALKENSRSSEELAEAIVSLRNALQETELTRFRVSQRDWEHYVTRCLMALVPELTPDEVDGLGADRVRILVDLDHLTPDVLPDDVLREMVETGELPESALAILEPQVTPVVAEKPDNREAGASTHPPEETVEAAQAGGPEKKSRSRSTGVSRERDSVASTA